nr:TDP-N-acetylfucosamine:lipid II N-acetylfucosaminyltransferase [Natronobacillus azotifigens]
MPNQKFTQSYIQFVNKEFNSYEHFFVILGEGNTENNPILLNGNVICVSKKIVHLFKLLREMNCSDKIILHSIFSSSIVILLFMQPWLLKKCYWVVWGGDLYCREVSNRGFLYNLYEFIRKSIIKKMAGLVTHIKGDYDLAKRWYGFKGKYYYSFLYPSNLYKDYIVNKELETTDRIYIQIGNSADPSNNHIEILDKVNKYKDMEIEIICPLSYGDEGYAETIINYGRNLYGEKFTPITEFMPFDKYLDILAKIDIAIFNHKRQQALGNIISLLGLGKKVYIRDVITTWQFCLDHDLKVYNANDDFENLFEEMGKEVREKNIKNVKRQFSESKLIEDWKGIFSEGEV